jgi:hypothetical protein
MIVIAISLDAAATALIIRWVRSALEPTTALPSPWRGEGKAK